MKSVILSCSLSEDSKSRMMAEELQRAWSEDESVESELVDLCELDLPACDGGSAYAHPATQELIALFSAADAVVFAVPIYNYDINAAAKNVIELAGRQLENKVAGFLCSAGGHRSYMSVMAVANSLMLDFRTVIVPRFVFAGGNDIPDRGPLSDPIRERIARFGAEFQKLARAVTTA